MTAATSARLVIHVVRINKPLSSTTLQILFHSGDGVILIFRQHRCRVKSTFWTESATGGEQYRI